MASINPHSDFTASGVDPVAFRAVSAAAKQWLTDSGKAEPDTPDVVRRDRASSLIFLEALTRKGFTCADSSGAAMQPPIARPNDGTAGLIGCGSILAMAFGLGLFWSGVFDGDKAAPRATAAAAAPSGGEQCNLPSCVDPKKAGVIPAGLDAAAVIKQQPADSKYVEAIAYALPTLERRDSYEPTAAFNDRLNNGLNRWSIGNFGPETRMLVKGGRSVTAEYEPDTGFMSVYSLDRPSTAEIGALRHTDTTADPVSSHEIKVRQETNSSSAMFFINTLPISYKGNAASSYVDHDRGQQGKDIRFSIAPEDARRVGDKLRFYYVVSFKAPDSAKGRAWRYTGSDSRGTPLLIRGGIYRNESRTSYMYMHLHQLILSDGQQVFWSRSYDGAPANRKQVTQESVK